MTKQATAGHWAEPSAPSQDGEARYRRAVESGLSQSEFESDEAAADAAIDRRIGDARATGAVDASRWDAIYRAAVCAAAQAVQSKAWEAKRQALAIAAQADRGRQVVLGAIFGARREIPHQYAALEAAGRGITREQSSAALRLLAADKPQRPADEADRMRRMREQDERVAAIRRAIS